MPTTLPHKTISILHSDTTIIGGRCDGDGDRGSLVGWFVRAGCRIRYHQDDTKNNNNRPGGEQNNLDLDRCAKKKEIGLSFVYSL